MSKELIAFDYADVDKETKGKLIALAGQVKRHEKDFIKSGMEIGEAISQAHDLLAGDGRDGRFKQWVELETGLSRSSAYDWMHAYERAKKCPILDTLPPTVTLLMSAPGVPDAAIKDFEKQLDKGTKPTIAAAKATLDKFREAADKSNGKARTSAPKKQAAPQTDNPCSRGEHDFDDEACRRCHEPKPEKPDEAGKLFSKLLEHLRQATLLLDQINKVAKDDKMRQEVFDSLDCANKDIQKWRKQSK